MADPLDNLASSEQLRRLLLQEEQERIERLEARLGNDDVLRQSLVPLIADVLRDAGVEDHRRLADSLAPIVLQSIKSEIRNSRDMMVDALYPITGRLVAAAVRNAFKDLVDQLNAKLDSTLSTDRWRAKVKALLSGRSEAEVLLSEGAAFEIVDLLLIDRQSGLLIAQARSEDQAGGDSHLLGSILAAIMAFVRDAMRESGEQDLRTLDVGDVRLHLQASPAAILAIKTKGPPPAGFETALNETFYAFLSRWGHALGDPGDIESREAIALTDDLQQRFQTLLQTKSAGFKTSSNKAVLLLGSLAALAALWLGWTIYAGWSEHRIETLTHAVIDGQRELKGYPIDAVYRRDLGSLAISGLLPNEEATGKLRDELQRSLPEITLVMDVGVLPNQTIDQSDIPSKGDLAAWQAAYGDEMLAIIEQRQNAAREDIASLLDQRILAFGKDFATRDREEELDRRLAALSDTVTQIEPRLLSVAEVEHAVFRSWLDRQAIGFGRDSEWTDEALANDVLEELTDRFSRLPEDVGLRVVGYSDELGEDSVSSRISRDRAALVAEKLRRLGIPQGRLVAVGRGNERRIANIDGTASVNRRVEFELTYLSGDGSTDNSSNETGRGTR